MKPARGQFTFSLPIQLHETHIKFSPSRFVLRDRRNRRRNPEPMYEEEASERPPCDVLDVAIEYADVDDATDSTSSPSDSKFDDDLDF